MVSSLHRWGSVTKPRLQGQAGLKRRKNPDCHPMPLEGMQWTEHWTGSRGTILQSQLQGDSGWLGRSLHPWCRHLKDGQCHLTHRPTPVTESTAPSELPKGKLALLLCQDSATCGSATVLGVTSANHFDSQGINVSLLC